MTLTEQFKKGELKVGEEYWVILTDEWYLRSPVVPVRAFYSCECEFEGYLDNDIKEVLAPVPSYDEWQQLHKFLEEFNALEVTEENKRLKDLLRRCKYPVILAFNRATEDDADEYCKLWDEIDEAIGEK